LRQRRRGRRRLASSWDERSDSRHLGEKINKLRKSYENKIKEFAGKNKPISKEGEFFNLLNYPDEEWSAQQLHGKELSQSLNTDTSMFSHDLEANLDAAFAGISSGSLPQPERDRWRALIDAAPVVAKPKQADPHRSGRSTPAQIVNEEPQRPRRRGTKRNYNDEAFEGYNEGYVDDDHDELADDDDDKSNLSTGSRKRRRRVRFAEPPSTPPSTPKTPSRPNTPSLPSARPISTPAYTIRCPVWYAHGRSQPSSIDLRAALLRPQKRWVETSLMYRSHRVCFAIDAILALGR